MSWRESSGQPRQNAAFCRQGRSCRKGGSEVVRSPMPVPFVFLLPCAAPCDSATLPALSHDKGTPFRAAAQICRWFSRRYSRQQQSGPGEPVAAGERRWGPPTMDIRSRLAIAAGKVSQEPPLSVAGDCDTLRLSMQRREFFRPTAAECRILSQVSQLSQGSEGTCRASGASFPRFLTSSCSPLRHCDTSQPRMAPTSPGVASQGGLERGAGSARWPGGSDGRRGEHGALSSRSCCGPEASRSPTA